MIKSSNEHPMSIHECELILDKNKRELITGNYAFPVMCNNDTYNRGVNLLQVPLHWHEEFELNYVISGKLEISVEFEKVILNVGDCIFINSTRFHSCLNFENTNCRIKSIIFNPRVIYGDIGSIYFKKYIRPLLKENSLDFVVLRHDFNEQNHVIKDILHIYDTVESEECGYEFEIRNYLSKIILFILNNNEIYPKRIPGKRIRDLKRNKEMLLFIENHFSEEISLSEIAASANISESECLRCFNSILGETPMQYVKKYRLQKAEIMLTTTSLSIIDIGLSCGFNEMSYFAKLFGQTYGTAPLKYRKENIARLHKK